MRLNERSGKLKAYLKTLILNITEVFISGSSFLFTFINFLGDEAFTNSFFFCAGVEERRSCGGSGNSACGSLSRRPRAIGRKGSKNAEVRRKR